MGVGVIMCKGLRMWWYSIASGDWTCNNIYLIILILILLHLVFLDVEGDPNGKVKVMPLLFAHRYV